MNEILQAIVFFVISVGVLITFHEFGHFWVARFFNVKILRFSIGIGRSIYAKRFGKDQTEFSIGLLPLGGYVKMLDDREGEVTEKEKKQSRDRYWANPKKENLRTNTWKKSNKEKVKETQKIYLNSEVGYFKELWNGIKKSKHEHNFKNYEDFFVDFIL